MTVTYRVRHKTVYGYSSPVTLSHHSARLKPRETPYQHILSSDISVEPQPTFQTQETDAFGNTAVFFIVETPHNEMTIVSNFTASITPPVYPNPEKTLSCAQTAALLSAPDTPDLLEASEMTCPSCFIPLTPEIKKYAALSIRPERPVLEAAEEIMRRIYQDFTYDPAATSIATPINETLAMKRGVCQDFAHVGIACLRSFGLAARYVSGYIRTHRKAKPEAQNDIEMIGGDASHAWFSVYVPDFGWVDLDPTNNMYMQSEHLSVGWGRDFDDMSPVKGIMTGGGTHTVSVDVAVCPITGK
ncbi:MAG: transglutaminase family protein [Alphaproteobacteria bacterium]|nr:transglutaminase family protein [Alphaproteobacteria bacterium]